MNHTLFFSIPLFLFVGLFACKAQDSETEATIEAIQQSVNPISTIDPEDDLSDLHFLKAALTDKDVIGLGEVTHGTHEVFQYKDRLIRFLVSELGFRAIAFEADYSVLEYLDQYINAKPIRLNQLEPGDLR